MLFQPGRAHLEKHYADLSAKPFFASLVEYMDSGPVFAMVTTNMVFDFWWLSKNLNVKMCFSFVVQTNEGQSECVCMRLDINEYDSMRENVHACKR